MHELSIVEAVVQQVIERVGDRRVARVHLRVGALTAVLPDAMRFCFEAVTATTTLEGAALEIEEVRARGRCRDCGTEGDLEGPVPLCACGSADLALLAGTELVIQEVEVL